ncbi:MAG TPA: dihydrofolate reductase [Cyclobacteriaceae bacterium]|nr:dihydrofolate reductase [Cyclobacteriaceae bacterium]
MIKSVIVAVSENGVIGSGNQLPWKLSDDLMHFKSLTMGKFIIMGRNTFLSIGRPLKGRTNIVLTRNNSLEIAGVLTMHSLGQALEYAEGKNQEEVFIIGGADIYRQAVMIVDKIYYTRVAAHIRGNVYFPDLNWSEWKVKSSADYLQNDKNQFPFQILELERLS